MPGLKLLRITTLALALILMGGTAAGAVVLKIATLSPDGSSWMIKMREGATQVAEATQGRVQFKFYPGGVMGNDQAVLRKIRIGQLQGGAFSGGTLSGYYPDAQIYGLPLKFRSLEEVYYVRQQMDALIMKGLEKKGFVSFGLADGGFSYIMSNQPVEKVDALKQRKVWIPSHDRMIMQAMEGFDIDPISLPIADVRTGLQTGLIDTVAISPVGAIVLQWHTQVKYLTKLPMVYVYGILAVDRKAFARIPAEDQSVVRRVMAAVWREMDAMNRADNISAMNAIQSQGIQFIEPRDQIQAAWYDLAAAVNQEITDRGYFSPEMVTQLESHLQSFRSRQAQAP
jgi:TRAP-type C4-dicarboxylate transport system substrate-binding protein